MLGFIVGPVCSRLRRRGAFCKGVVSTARRGGLPFAPAKGSKTGQRGTKLSPLQTPLTLSCAGYECCFSLNNREKQIRTAHRCAPKVACGSICPYRLAVPEKIFALLACSIFSTATDAPPRCIRHWRRSAPHPAHRDPFPGPGLLGYPSYLLHRSVSSAVTSGRWAFRSHICKSGAICARQPAAARPGRLYISRSAGFASSSASVSSRAV